MLDDLNKGTKKSLKRYQKRNKSASTTKIKRRSMVIPQSDAHSGADIDNMKMEISMKELKLAKF